MFSVGMHVGAYLHSRCSTGGSVHLYIIISFNFDFNLVVLTHSLEMYTQSAVFGRGAVCARSGLCVAHFIRE